MSFYGNIINLLAKIKVNGKIYEPSTVDNTIDLSDAFLVFSYDKENQRLIISGAYDDNNAELGKAKLGKLKLGKK